MKMEGKYYFATVLLFVSSCNLKAVHSSPCAFKVEGSKGVISSPSSWKSTNCSWLIVAPRDLHIRLTFTSFRLSYDWRTNSGNWLKVWDAQTGRGTLLGTFRGTMLPFTVQSSGRFMFITASRKNIPGRHPYFKGVYTSDNIIDTPKVILPVPLVRALPDHWLWCAAQGTPPIEVTLLRNSTILVNGTGTAMVQINDEGNYTCVASNKAGCDTRHFPVIIASCDIHCYGYGDITDGEVKNTLFCSGAHSSVDVFKCVPTTATILYLPYHNIGQLPVDAFPYLTALKYLDLYSNGIQELPENVFDNLSSLQKLELGLNSIQELPESVFSNLSSLNELYLRSNKIQELPESVFFNLSSLQTLDLESNKIQELPESVFSTLSSLHNLNVGFNRIRELPECVFSTLYSLQILELFSNRIQELPENVFDNLSSLQILQLGRNDIVSLPAKVFDKLHHLQALFLRNNRLKQLPEAIRQLPSLLHLFVSDNNITGIPDGFFSNQRNLFSLSIQGNSISSITKETFAGVTNLHYLLLNNNSLTEIPDYAFSDQRNVKVILLSDNNITTIGKQAFKIMSSNLLIYIIRTNLKSISLRSFSNIDNLTFDIAMEDGQIGGLTLSDVFGKQRCNMFLGLGDDETKQKVVEGADEEVMRHLSYALQKSGFGVTSPGFVPLPCPTGTFWNSSWNDDTEHDCQKCPPGGFYSDTKAFVGTSCRRCPDGTFVPPEKAPGKHARDCRACPQGTDTDRFAGFRACNCLNGFYRTHLFKRCQPCPESGFYCPNESAILKSGFWWKWPNDTHKQLYSNFTTNVLNPEPSYDSHLVEYPMAIPKPHQCPREQSCKGGLHSACESGYQGPLCEVCTSGYYKQFQECKVCPTKKWMIGQISIVATIILIIVAVVVWTSKRKNKENRGRPLVDVILARLKIILGFYQVTFGLLDAFSNIEWPDSLAAVTKYSKVLQLSVLQIAPVHCLFPSIKIDAFGSLFAILIMNGAVIVLAGVIYAVKMWLIARNREIKDGEKIAKISQTKELVYRNMFFFLYVTYLSTCSQTANVLPLACHKVCLDKEENNCKEYLKADYQITCGSPRYDRLVIVAYCVVAYIVILPVASFVVLWRRHKMIRPTGNEVLRDTQKDKELLTGLQFLFENYNDGSWYWELVETARKVTLTSGLVLIGEESRAYIGLACVMSGLYGILFAYVRPIKDPFENKLMLTSLAVTFVNLGIGAVSKIPEENIPGSIDKYKDSITFQILVIGANALVIGLLVAQYGIFLYRSIKEWRKRPQWSLSCCLAFLLPLNDLQGELRGVVGKNVLKQQIQSGKMGKPSIATSVKDGGGFNFNLTENAEEITDTQTSSNNKAKSVNSTKQTHIASITNLALSTIQIHRKSSELEETAF